MSRNYRDKPMPKPTRPAIGDDDDPMTVNQACAFFEVSPVSLWRMVNQGRIPKPFYPRPRAPRWTRGELRKAREQMRMLPAEAKAAHRASKLQADAAPAT
jgi:predicted DNA-binding transcriptional regulator AlpA